MKKLLRISVMFAFVFILTKVGMNGPEYLTFNKQELGLSLNKADAFQFQRIQEAYAVQQALPDFSIKGIDED